MAIYPFYCPKCKLVHDVEMKIVDYHENTKCKKCKVKLKRIFTVVNINPGALNGANIPH